MPKTIPGLTSIETEYFDYAFLRHADGSSVASDKAPFYAHENDVDGLPMMICNNLSFKFDSSTTASQFATELRAKISNIVSIDNSANVVTIKSKKSPQLRTGMLITSLSSVYKLPDTINVRIPSPNLPDFRDCMVTGKDYLTFSVQTSNHSLLHLGYMEFIKRHTHFYEDHTLIILNKFADFAEKMDTSNSVKTLAAIKKLDSFEKIINTLFKLNLTPELTELTETALNKIKLIQADLQNKLDTSYNAARFHSAETLPPVTQNRNPQRHGLKYSY